MSESSDKNTNGPDCKLPPKWQVFLVNAKMRIVASNVSNLDPKAQIDLADFLSDRGYDLAEVGELLVCLEDLPSDCELRMRLGNEGEGVVAKGVKNIPGLSCVVLRPKLSMSEEQPVKSAWDWATEQVRGLGLSLPRGGAPIRLMVVDENPEVVAYGKILARKLGCRSEGAQSGGEALAAAKKQLFDLVIVDDLMPGMGTRVLCQLLKERSARHWGRAPLVATMAEETRLRHLEGDYLLEKPIAIGDLSQLVNEARVVRSESEKCNVESNATPVLKLELWAEDKPLLCRLSKALVAQGTELAHRLRVEAGYSRSEEFARELLSLKNGCDILHAGRLAGACQDLLDEFPELAEKDSQSLIEHLLVEIESFRLFAAGNGLLNRD